MDVKQFSHLIFASGNDITKQEVWVPSDKLIQPSGSRQITVGWNGGFYSNMFRAELSLYGTQLSHLVTFKEGYSTFDSQVGWQSVLESGGQGKSIGAELLVRKNRGNLTGFLSYTLSKTMRQYQGINLGKEYLFDYDRTHSFSLSANYNINEHISISASWIYQTGLPYTPAVGLQAVSNSDGDGYHEELIYGERNSRRMEAYHRLDVGLTYKKTNWRERQTEWNFSVYNLYNRHNPYYYYYNTNESGEIYNPSWSENMQSLKLYKMSFFPVIPTVSYKIYFNKSEQRKEKTAGRSGTFMDWLKYKN